MQHPRILEGVLTSLDSLLFILGDHALVNTPALVDQVTSGGPLSWVDMANDEQVDVGLLVRHFVGCVGLIGDCRTLHMSICR